MRPNKFIRLASIVAIAACSNGSNAPSGPAPTPTTGTGAPNISWGPAPSVFPPGAEMAVLEGDPSKAMPFTVRLRFPDGYKVPPHTHPTTENVTVLSGTFLAGMGPQFVESEMQPLAAGAFASVPAEHAHYAMARGQTVVQVHALGPFALTYVNRADTPASR